MNEKISSMQFGLLFFSFVGATIILIVPGVMVSFAKQDAWISVFPASISGVVCILIMTALANRYPGLTITQYGSRIVGKWLGKCLGLYYLFFLFLFISQTVNNHIEFVSSVLLPESPSLVIILALLVICCLTVRGGIEVIGRCTEFLIPIIILFLIPLFILALKDSDPGQLKPLLARGLLPVLQGAIVPTAWMSQFFFFGWLIPFLNQPEKARRISLIALGGVIILMVIIDVLTIMVFGPVTDKLSFPFLSVIQYIGIQGSFERLEAFAVSMWMMGIFLKASVLLFIFCLHISHLFELQDYRKFMIPVTLLSVIGSVWVSTNAAELNDFLTFTYPVMGLVNQTLIPLLLLIIDVLKKKHSLL
ncbi:endospore germination permease [Paenibacillus sp. MWE-103]|uniref:Endospore germination permease n=1 Tax=Paenibacillus artemisiicola TaxID=1172618 RepID=A0ABS3W650_9BACL|nr:endospore germination permease [Paenibacillus artemisiicola]MBO7743787.1 endospore germination permease [Paenibacillus artemisiicola]